MKIKNIAVGDFVQIKKSLCHSEFKAKQLCEVIDIDYSDRYGFDVLIQGKNCLDWVSHKDLKKPETQLKQLDQSVFDGLDSKWKYAAVDEDGSVNGFDMPVYPHGKYNVFMFVDDYANSDDNSIWIGGGYDTSNWQNSLIERESVLRLEKLTDEKLLDEPESQLKQLDQSVFYGLEENWRFAAVDGYTGRACVYTHKPHASHDRDYWYIREGNYKDLTRSTKYDTSNWQNSLIERESVELTGSDLCHEMLKRGDKAVMCKINESNHMTIIVGCKESKLGGWVFHSHRHSNHYIVTPINNQGEPLTASEAGF